MKQVIFDKKGRIFVKEVPVPTLGKEEVLVRNEYSVLSAGTEKSMIELMKKPLWKMALERPDLTKQVIDFAMKSGLRQTKNLVKSRLDVWHLLGYSSAGIVIETGSLVHEFSKGDRVACIGSGFANHAGYIAVPSILVTKIPKKVSSYSAAHTGIACIALQSIRQLNPKLGDKVVVLGVGFIGDMVSQILKANGCRVIEIDKDTKTKVTGADGVIIAAATKSNLINDAIDMCRKGGRVVLLGVCGMQIDREKMFSKEVDFKISTAFGPGSLDKNQNQIKEDYVKWTAKRNMMACLQLIANNKLKFQISKIYDISVAERAYTAVLKNKIVSAVFKYSNKTCKYKYNICTKANKTGKGTINVGLVGAGQFVKGFILPNLQKIKDVRIRGVVTRRGTNALKLAGEVGSKYATTDYKEALKDKDTDIIIIGTRHDSHAKIAIDALEARKHVFCEKPMAIKEKEFKTLKKKIANSNKIYACGFNRRYAPAILSIKKELSNKPMIINYIFNNPSLPEDHWVNLPEVGGGRFVGEACHIINLFNFLTGSRPILVDSKKYDNNSLVASLKYEDGSICSLTYSCVGNAAVEREKMMISQEGTIFEMKGFGKVLMNSKKLYSGKTDEGHTQEMIELMKAVRGEENKLISPRECILATETVFEVLK